MYRSYEWGGALARFYRRIESLLVRALDGLSASNYFVRALVTIVAVFLMGLASPVCDYGPYSICIYDLSVGLIVVIMSIGGRNRYAIPCLVGQLLVNYCNDLSAYGSSCLVISLITIAGCYVSALASEKISININSPSFSLQVVFFIFAACILPCIFGACCLFIAKEYGLFVPALNDPHGAMANKIIFQDCLAKLSGILLWVSWTCILWRNRERGISCIARTSVLQIVSLLVILLVLYAQFNKEMRVSSDLFNEMANNFRHTVEQELRLELFCMQRLGERICNSPSHYPTAAELADIMNVTHNNNHHLWSFFGYCPYVPESEVKNYQHCNQKIVSVGDLGTLHDAAGNRAYFPLSYLDVAKGAFPQKYASLGTDLAGLESFRCGLQHVLQHLTHDTIHSNDDHYYFTSIGDQQVFLESLYSQNKLIGVAFIGVNYAELIENTYAQFISKKLGVRCTLIHHEDGGDKAVEVSNINYSVDPVITNTDFLDIGLRNVYYDAKLDCSTRTKKGFFLNQTISDLFLCCICMALVMFLTNIIYSQYLLVCGKVQAASREIDVRATYNGMILSAMRNLLITTDLQGSILVVNPAVVKALGYSEAELIGADLHSLLHNGQDCYATFDCELCQFYYNVRELYLQGVKDLSDHKTNIKGVAVDKYDVACDYEFSLSVINRDKGPNILIILRNISQEVRWNKMRSEYIATLSHEMRTPLSCVKGTVDMLGKFGERLITDNKFNVLGRNMIDVAARNIDSLSRLVNDVLLVDSVENNKLHIALSYQEMAPIVNKVLEEVESIAQRSRIALVKRDIQGKAMIDEMRISQVLNNLISNAIKYSEPDSEIVITSYIDEEEKTLIVAVCDQGEGIPADKISKIFDRFEVVDSSSVRKRGGIGLGLAICRGLVMAHGGFVWLESILGVGSNFYFALPLGERSENDPTPEFNISNVKKRAFDNIPLLRVAQAAAESSQSDNKHE